MSNRSEPIDYQTRLKEALLALQKMRTKLESVERLQTEPIAVIGIGCRFPGGVNSPQAFWQLLVNGVDAIREVPPERWDINAYYDPDPDAPGKLSTRWGGFIEAADQFDAHFFGIAPREAKRIDPQQRLLLEVAWEALEHAGQSPAGMMGSQTGVFIGISNNDYLRLQEDLNDIDAYRITGNALNSTAGRLSYTLGLHGPCMAMDSACSSSLVAVHLAVQSLRSRESEIALAGGVNLILSPEMTISATKAKMMAADGRCKTFDARADGFVRSEGCGVIVLKRLSDAQANGDNILAVIRGTAVNQDGFSSGFTVPNKLAQEAVIRAALTNAGVEPAQVSYVEAHGTGTPLGDPIEVRALAAVLSQGRPKESPFMLGSVKTNIGHLESAAGIAGLIKLVLALQHEEIPPHLHLQKLNPHIAWSDVPAVIPTGRTPWTGNERIAGLSSFGASGTNAHAVVAAAPAAEPAPVPGHPSYPLALSAKSDAALQQLAKRYAQHLAAQPAPLADVCFTASSGRTHFTHRLALTADSTEQAREKLAAFIAGQKASGLANGVAQSRTQPKVAFLFTGQGSQYRGMGRQLYETQPIFRKALDKCDELLRSYLGQSLLSVIYPEPGTSPLIDETAYTQPALFAIEYSLAKLWQSWGVEPSAAMGHSVGEYVAACVAGVFSLEDGLKLIAERGRLMQAQPAGGKMAAILADEARVREAVAPYLNRVSIAAVNGPRNVVISGAGEVVDAILQSLETSGVKTRRLVVSHAFHSPLMEPMLDGFESVARQVQFKAPRIALISNVTGQAFKPGELPDAAYWRRHVREAVRFASAIETLQAQGCELFLEIGPSPTLIEMGQQCLPEGAGIWLPSLRKKRDDWSQMLESLGRLYTQGVEIEWGGFYQGESRRRVPLPTYPFQHERHWIQPGPRRAAASPSSRSLPGKRLRSAGKEIVFETQLGPDWPAFVNDHRIFGTAILPAAFYLELAASAGKAALNANGSAAVVESLIVHEVLVLPDDGACTVQTVLTPESLEVASFKIFSLEAEKAEGWRVQASGKVRIAPADSPKPLALEELRARGEEAISAETHYQQLRERGLDFGSCFQGVAQIWRRAGEALGEIQLPESLMSETADYDIHPALLDACLQVVGTILPDGADTYLPIGIDRFRLYARPATRLWSLARLRLGDGANTQTLTADVRLLDEAGNALADVEGFHFKRASREALQRAGERSERNYDDWLYEVEWRLKPLEAQGKPKGQGKWLILADSQGVGETLAKRLAESGETCETLRVSKTLRVSDQLLSQENWRGVVHLWSLDVKVRSDDFSRPTADANAAATNLEQDQALVCGSALHLVQAIAKMQTAEPPRLWLVTRGAQAVNDEPVSAAQAPLWGLGGVIALEHPELRCARVDLSPASDETESLLAELRSNETENQIALRREGRYVARLARSTSGQKRQPVQLQITNYGTLDNLTLQPASRRSPGPGEVEIQVHATGLNFKEVLNVLGMIGEDVPLGNECAGTAAAVGEGVSRFNVGDEVIALAPHSFSTFAIANAELVIHKPAAMSFAEAATIPITFLTAYYGLHHLAKMKAGDKVLIHAAAGGVGLAAVQLAQRAGAEVFATVGSAEKRKHLESLGVTRIMNSRALDFAGEIMATTNGRGVDIVLNSLSGDFIAKSLSALAPNGRFLEIGKRGIWSQEQMAQARPDVSYAAFDLSDTIRSDPASIQTMLEELMATFAEGSLKPLPRRAFPLSDAASAFRYMAQAKQIGKIVITQHQPVVIRGGASYLITGGLGGLGLRVARWLADQGARNLVLAGRSQPGEAASRVVSDLQEMGVHVRIAQADVSKADQVQELLASIAPTLKGIVHAAGALDDGILQQQNWQKFTRATAPKIDGAWNLHMLTQHVPLDFFVLFSSAASLLGSSGQGNYAAGNAFMDALAHYRKAQGLPALSLNWGAWSEVGMAAALEGQDQRRWAAQGMGAMTPEQGLAIFGELLDAESAQIGVLPINWTTLSRRGNESPLLSELLAQAQAKQAQPARGQPEILSRLAETPPNKKLSVLSAHVSEQAIRVLGLNPSQAIDPRQPLNEMGLDSLMAVELRNALGQSLGRTLPATLLFDYPTLESLAGYVFNDVLAFGNGQVEEQAEAKEEADQRAAAVAELAQLSDEEAEALLLAELANSKKEIRK